MSADLSFWTLQFRIRAQAGGRRWTVGRSVRDVLLPVRRTDGRWLRRSTDNDIVRTGELAGHQEVAEHPAAAATICCGIVRCRPRRRRRQYCDSFHCGGVGSARSTFVSVRRLSSGRVDVVF